MAKHPETGKEIIDNLPDELSDYDPPLREYLRTAKICHCSADCPKCQTPDECPC